MDMSAQSPCSPSDPCSIYPGPLNSCSGSLEPASRATEGTSCVCSLEGGLLCAMHVHMAGAALFPCSQDFSFLGLETQDRLMIITGLKGM